MRATTPRLAWNASFNSTSRWRPIGWWRRTALTPAEARRRALAAFGGVEKHKEALRDDRGFAWLGGLSLNLKLGLRMMAKYPGISMVGGLAMAIGVGLGAAYLEVMNDFLHPTLPFEEGNRIVGLQNWDQVENKPELRSAHDFVQWRGELKAIEGLAAFRAIERNIGAADVLAEPTEGAEMSASPPPRSIKRKQSLRRGDRGPRRIPLQRMDACARGW